MVDLEPDVTVSSPAINRVWCLRHVDVDDLHKSVTQTHSGVNDKNTYTWVVDGTVAHDTHLLTSGDLDGRGSSGLSRVVAAEVGAGDISDGGLSLEVVRLADINPLRGRRATDNERGERVCNDKQVRLCMKDAFMRQEAAYSGQTPERRVRSRRGRRATSFSNTGDRVPDSMLNEVHDTILLYARSRGLIIIY